jgi:hypothetical protein
MICIYDYLDIQWLDFDDLDTIRIVSLRGIEWYVFHDRNFKGDRVSLHGKFKDTLIDLSI